MLICPRSTCPLRREGGRCSDHRKLLCSAQGGLDAVPLRWIKVIVLLLGLLCAALVILAVAANGVPR